MSTTIVATARGWQRDGACRDYARFFQADGEPRRTRRQREADARAVCAVCPVRAECAAYALTAQERYGVWGGLTEHDRVRLERLGWLDLVDRRRQRVDVHGIEQRLRREGPVAAHDS